jgi:site-specific DNA-methyltransferase (adenine-specific)
MSYRLFNGDCLELMKRIPDKFIDLILCDLPYGTTQCKWDSVIPFEPLWDQYRRIAKDNAAIVLTASQPFTTSLIASNMAEFKYCWVWDKGNPTNVANAKRQPLKYHEDVAVFYRKQCTYNPIKWEGKPNHVQGANAKVRKAESVGDLGRVADDLSGLKYPRSIVDIPKHSSQCGLHPTQKPVALMEYLVKTYTNRGDKVLDNCMGSGTTGVACANTERHFIGMEMNAEYFAIAKDRIEGANNIMESV